MISLIREASQGRLRENVVMGQEVNQSEATVDIIIDGSPKTPFHMFKCKFEHIQSLASVLPALCRRRKKGEIIVAQM